LKGREGFGFLSPSRRACEAGFSAFEKIKCIFSFAPVESLEKSQECFSMEAPDAKPVRLVCCQCLAVLGLSTRHQAPDVG